MTLKELRDVKVELLDTVHTFATEPVPDLEGARQHVDEISPSWRL